MLPDQLAAALSDLDRHALRRQRATLESAQGAQIVIDGQSYLSFASNDYLGLANHPEMVEAVRHAVGRWGIGSGASPLVTGHATVHEEAEVALAAFVGQPAALLFSSGYAANLAVIGSLLGREDAVFADRLNHASLHDACLLSRADFQRFRHNDPDHLEDLLRRSRARTRLIAVDAVYSMDGDQAPLAALLALAERYDAWLYLDDAHGFGVLGDGRGSLAGLPASERVVYMATLGKAAGVSGAFVAGSRLLIEWLINRARTYLFSTAHPPLLAAAVLASLVLIERESWRRDRLQAHVACLQSSLQDNGIKFSASRTPIQPLIIGDNELTLSMSKQLREKGLWVPAIRPPTVPKGGARLRVSLSAAHEEHDVNRLTEAIRALSAQA
ncbi:MAG: 8-amino-7-oxononanoate synthase [Paludibacterium sp.]|uniref:8-amino-7-oxononanoate synthase n=1 Tax=Paludibacterium sp. TaxID=1917523 RepID=UPI0025E6A7DE|nr:8-amino-7-oxononanoate synthase [Paludibacterium sp.]MBV8047568.1 8-amino-7-oxononanoate synthase [Paludibacterium sp.]MBV8649356.1 8-amino-7-oxononanoate synthase [Paludibacterium sp.]